MDASKNHPNTSKTIKNGGALITLNELLRI